MAAESSVVPQDLAKLVKSEKVVIRARIIRDGVVYARTSTHEGNSFAYFLPRGARTKPVPGRIVHIYERDGRLLVAFQRRVPIASEVLDPFRHYPYFRAQLYSTKWATDLEEIEASGLIGHYAAFQIDERRVVVKALALVSLPTVCSVQCLIYL